MQRNRRRVWTLLAILILLIAAGVIGFRFAASAVPGYRQQVEAEVSKAAGQPVHIGAMALSWRGLQPTLDLTDVDLLESDASSMPQMHARALRLGFSLARLIVSDWIPARADLYGLALQAEVDRVGHWQLRGFENTAGDPTDLLRQAQRLQRLRLVDCELDVHDATLVGDPLVFRLRSADVHHSGDGFTVEAQLQPPASMSGQAELRGSLDGDLSKMQSLTGEWLLSVHDLRGWPWLGQELKPGVALMLSNAQLRLDGKVDQGRVTEIVVRASAAQVLAQKDAQTVAKVSDFNLSGVARPTIDCWQVDLDKLAMTGARGAWSASKGRYQCSQADNGLGLTAEVEQLRLDDLAPWLGLWNELPDAAARVRDLHGDLRNVHLTAQPPDSSDRGEPQDYLSLDARLDNIGLTADAKQPGLSGISGDLHASSDGGNLNLVSLPLQLSVPQTFDLPLPVDALTADLSWHRVDRDWRIEIPHLDVKLAGAEAGGHIGLLIPADSSASPQIDLSLDFSSEDATRLKPFLPNSFGPKTHEWLLRAVVAARVPKGHVDVVGALADYPFVERPGGTWALDMEVADATLAFSREWPVAEQLHALLAFRGHGMTIEADHGELAGNPVDHLSGRIHNFHQGDLAVDGQVHADAARFYTLLRNSPVQEKLSGLIDKTDASGDAQLALHLKMDLTAEPIDPHAAGTVTLNGVELAVHGLDEPIHDITGAVDFDGAGVTAPELKGSFFEQPLNARIEAEPDIPAGVLKIQTRAPLIDDGLAATYVPAWLRAQLEGSAVLEARMPLGGEQAGRFSLSSDLTGMTSHLPAPLGKTVDQALPMRVQIGGGDVQPLRVGLEIGDVLRVGLRFALSGGHQITRGVEAHFGDGDIPRAQSDGIVVTGAPAEIEIAPWAKFLSGVGETAEPAPTPIPISTQTAAPLPAKGSAVVNHLGFTSADLQPERLSYDDIVIRRPHITIKPVADGYHADLDGNSTAGSIDWMRDGNLVVARLQHLAFDGFGDVAPATDGVGAVVPAAAAQAAAPDAVADNPSPPFEPTKAPTVDVVCTQLTVGDADLGSLTLKTSRVTHGQALDMLHLERGALSLEAYGNWLRADAGSSAAFDFDLTSPDIGSMLIAFGYEKTLDAKRARIKGKLEWAPNPAGLELAQAVGGVDLDVHTGALKTVKVGAGHLLGLFNLYVLPRRLLLDFRDVVDKGLAFDTLKGHFSLADGQARTDDIEIKSPSLKMELRGRIGLAAHDYDERVTVYPDVTAGVTLTAGLAAGPIGAAIALVAQELFDKPFNKLSQFSYHVTGPWDNPQIKRGDTGKPAAENPASTNVAPAVQPAPASASPPTPAPDSGSTLPPDRSEPPSTATPQEVHQ